MAHCLFMRRLVKIPTAIVSINGFLYTKRMDNCEHPFTRTEWLIGPDALKLLRHSHVAVFGVGGVGACAAEALARTGVGTLTLIDRDVVSITNINRQLHALHSTIGMYKTTVMRQRILDINPNAQVNALPLFFQAENEVTWHFDYVIDAVDHIAAKLQIILASQKRGIPIISVMGAGNKTHPQLFRVADIYQTQGCPLAKIVRKLCRQNQIAALKTVYSAEAPVNAGYGAKGAIGSLMYVTAAAGLLAAGEAVRDLSGS